MILHNEQIAELINALQVSTLYFVASNVSKDVLTDADKRVLEDAGLDTDEIPQIELINHAYYFGLLSKALKIKDVNKMTYEQFLSFIRSGKFKDLGKHEDYALKHIQRRAYNDIKGLGNRISDDLRTVVIEADRQQRLIYEGIIRRETAAAITKRETITQLASRIGNAVEDTLFADWTRDFGRMADYLMHEAYDNGRAQSILESRGKDAQVYKIVYSRACKHCVKLYLKEDVGSEPKIFKLTDLLENGSNIGRTVVEWQPVIGPTHPFCRCTLQDYIEGKVWNKDIQSFEYPKVEGGYKSKYGVRVIRS